MSGNINTELNTIKLQEQQVSGQQVSEQSASGKPNTVFDPVSELLKKKRVLTPEQEQILISKGLDPASLSAEQINKILLGMADVSTLAARQEKTLSSSSAEVNVDTAADVKTSSSAAVEDTKTAVTEQQQTDNQPVNSEVQPAEAKNSEILKNKVVYSEKDAIIDFKSEKNKSFELNPAETGVYFCDFNAMPEDKGADFLLQELTKYQVGKEKWAGMTEQQQKQAIDSVNAQLTKNVPSWSKLDDKGKIELTKFLLAGSPEWYALEKEYPDVVSKTLDEKLEFCANFVANQRVNERELECSLKKFNAALKEYIKQNPKYEGKSFDELNKSGEYTNAMYDFLAEKLAKNDGDINKLNKFEAKLYKQLKVGKALSPNGDLKNWGSYGNEGQFDKIISDVNEELASDLALHSKGSDEYKEAFRNRIIKDFENGTADCWSGKYSQFKTLMENGNPVERMMLLEIFQSLPKDIQEKINLNLVERIQNVGVASANGDDKAASVALQDVRVKAFEDDNKEVLDKSIENINEIIEDDNIATESITDGLKVGGADGYQKGVKSGKISAQQVTDVGNVVLDKENNDIYASEVQNKVVETIGHSTIEGRKGLIDKAAENERTIKTAAAVYDTFGKDFEIYSAQKIAESAEAILPEDEAIAVLKIAADTNTRCDASNQAEIHKVFVNSKYDEVAEHAASNIYKYDEAAQADAIKYTYETNNTKAIDACNGQIEQCAPEAIREVGTDVVAASVAQTVERVTSGAAAVYAESVIENNKITNNQTEQEELKGLPDREKAQLLYAEFKKATPSEQFRMLSKLSKDQLKAVISMLCKANSSVIKGLVSQGLGNYVLQTIGKSPDVLYMTVGIMMGKGGKDAKYASEYVVAKQSTVHFSEDTLVKANETLGRSDEVEVPESETKKYVSNPYGFMKSALYPTMSAVYPGRKELFFKA